jgi:hypothetical protein
MVALINRGYAAVNKDNEVEYARARDRPAAGGRGDARDDAA